MTSGIARRRAAKAVRRKKLLAERRKADHARTASPLIERVRRLAAAPLHACLVQEGLLERGNGMAILARRTEGRLVAASFLLDPFCLGVKDVAFGYYDISEFEEVLAGLEPVGAMAATDPSEARKLLRDLVAWARTLGIEPHADYAAAELLFGDHLADASDAEFHFGREGKPLYIPGPGDTPARIRQRTEQLRRRLGEDGFEVLFEDEGDDGEWYDDPEIEGEPGYDPDEAPDPAEWLALDETERQIRVTDYHRRAGDSLPNEDLHAAFHAVVETQFALGDETPVRRAVERLMAEGLGRHEAIHAVASVLSDHLYDLRRADAADRISPDSFGEDYAAGVEALTAEGWRRKYESDEPDDAQA